MKLSRGISFAIVLLSAAISILWGGSYALEKYEMTDFMAVYCGTRCLLQHQNPYNASALGRVVAEEDGERPSRPITEHQGLTNYVNLPSTFVFVAPFAILPFGTARILYLLLLDGLFLLSSILMWDLGTRYAPGVSLFLTCLIVANSLVIFTDANTAGIAVPLCVVGVWCFVSERFPRVGVLCMALSLAIKPHDSGFIWLYFLLVGGAYRRRALQSAVGAAAISLSGAVWLTAVAPRWFYDWRTNMSVISAHGGINDPGPASIFGFHNLGPVIDLQSVISVFHDDPAIYNSITYLVCGSFLLVWAIVTLRTHFSMREAWLALAVAVPFTILVTYHRPYDAKLLLLTIPACAVLWAEGGPKRWLSLLVSTIAFAAVGDISMAIYLVPFKGHNVLTNGLFAQIATVVAERPIPVIILITGVFYFWAYVWPAAPIGVDATARPRDLAVNDQQPQGSPRCVE